MFSKNDDGILVLKIGVNSYDFLNVDNYIKLILYLTNPDIKIEPNLTISPDLQQEELIICEKYKEFINKYIDSRSIVEQEIKIAETTDKLELVNDLE